jgi:hypothetical protein
MRPFCPSLAISTARRCGSTTPASTHGASSGAIRPHNSTRSRSAVRAARTLSRKANSSQAPSSAGASQGSGRTRFTGLANTRRTTAPHGGFRSRCLPAGCRPRAPFTGALSPPSAAERVPEASQPVSPERSGRLMLRYGLVANAQNPLSASTTCALVKPAALSVSVNPLFG